MIGDASVFSAIISDAKHQPAVCWTKVQENKKYSKCIVAISEWISKQISPNLGRLKLLVRCSKTIKATDKNKGRRQAVNHSLDLGVCSSSLRMSSSASCTAWASRAALVSSQLLNADMAKLM